MYKSQTCNRRGHSSPCIWCRGLVLYDSLLSVSSLQIPAPTFSLDHSRGSNMEHYIKEHLYDDNYDMVGESNHFSKKIKIMRRSFQSLLFLKLWQTKLIDRLLKVLNFALYRRIYSTAQQQDIKMTHTSQITTPRICFTQTCKL